MYRQIDANDRVDTQDVEAQNTRAANPEANDGLRRLNAVSKKIHAVLVNRNEGADDCCPFSSRISRRAAAA